MIARPHIGCIEVRRVKRIWKYSRFFIAALAMLALLPFVRMEEESIQTGSWGLSFQTEGQAPNGNADRQTLAKYDAAYIGAEDEKVIYLTFDAGYENGCTEKILDVLKQHDVRAAFFLVGNYLEQNGALVKRMVKEGHIVGNHTYHHWDMSKLSDRESFENELRSLEVLYEQTVGQELPKFYRPPQGIYSEENLKMAQQMGYKTVFWSLAYVDWYNDKQPTSQEAFSKLIPRIHNGAVVLLHSTSRTNAEILDELLNRYKELGYRFEGIDTLFEEKNTTNH